MKLTDIKGIGPKTGALFAKLHIETAEDLISYYPVHYDEYLPPVPAGDAVVGGRCAVEGRIARGVFRKVSGSKTIITTEIDDLTGKLHLIWYNAPYVGSLLKKGSVFIFRGTVTRRRNELYMEHPEIFTLHAYDEKIKTLSPVYGLTKGLTNNAVVKAVKGAFALVGAVPEYLPERVLETYGLMGEEEASYKIHFPADKEEFIKARRRIAFDELFLFILAMRTLKARQGEDANAFPMKLTWDTEELIGSLPFALTHAQERTWQEIEADLSGSSRMSRLIQGDVGSGKTILAFLAMQMCASNGYQSALMAPTEVLARQHYEKLCALVEEHHIEGLHPVLLTGSLSASAKKKALALIADGSANAVIGTHALIEERVSYKALALVITDEQHRFGVCQREALSDKGGSPHMMVMSATPIPRTLGIVWYGDLAVSVIDELPGNRLPIRNCVVGPSYMPAALRFIKKEAEAGHQAYVICPMIESSDGVDAENVFDAAKKIRKELPGLTVGILHGRMKPAEKDAVMEAFRTGETTILVSTTVVEVGVDVPNATVMLVINAERFGLAQLHQLRGRVGRGSAQSYCIFMAGLESETVTKRMEILNRSNDGFEIAEKDFELRGPGDLLGIRQSGDAVFRLADPAFDRELMEKAGKLAAAVVGDSPSLEGENLNRVRQRLDRFMQESMRTITL